MTFETVSKIFPSNSCGENSTNREYTEQKNLNLHLFEIHLSRHEISTFDWNYVVEKHSRELKVNFFICI